MPVLTIEDFKAHFEEEVTLHKVDWQIVGFLGSNRRVYPFGTDTKVLSTIFESLSSSLVTSIAERFDYSLETSEQTVYPDFTLSPKGRSKDRIAIDIKTTYRRGLSRRGDALPFRYTLGSYTSFLRSGTKNIKYPYSEYTEHWIIGFLYTRNISVSTSSMLTVEEASKDFCPYSDVDFFVQDKYKIVGETPASGNTANLGSISSNNLDDFRKGNGPFAMHGKQACDAYWKNYARTAAERAKSYSSLNQYFEWIAAQVESVPEIP